MARQPEFEEKRVEVQREEQSDEDLPIVELLEVSEAVEDGRGG